MGSRARRRKRKQVPLLGVCLSIRLEHMLTCVTAVRENDFSSHGE